MSFVYQCLRQFFCLIASDCQTFCSLFMVRWYIIGCINHDIVRGLCSELLMRLFNYIHLGYGKNILISYGDRTRVHPHLSHQLCHWTRALTLKICNIHKRPQETEELDILTSIHFTLFTQQC